MRKTFVFPYCFMPVLVTGSVLPGIVLGQDIPVPCGTGTCGPTGPSAWISAGNATSVASQGRLDVTQTTDSVTLNWRGFNIGAGAQVNFNQPSSTAVALNRVFDNDPTKIAGALSANGRVYLLNRNGIVFGDGARVNVGGLIASTLDITPAAVSQGVARAANSSTPAFAQFSNELGEALESAGIVVENGALLESESGQIFMFAPEIRNSGTIETPGGQAILAAGTSIYLTTSSDENLRGLLVEVGGDGGVVTNGVAANAGVTDPAALVGKILAERGNVTLAGIAVNQLGRVSATTTVRENGTIRLQARAGGSAVAGGSTTATLLSTTGGDLKLGERSVTEVALAADDATTLDVNEQPESRVELAGRRIDLLANSRVAAKSGRIEITAQDDPRDAAADFGLEASDARVYVAAGSVLDVSGARKELPMERNEVKVELRGNQLRDSPLQRDGALRGKTVVVDARASGERADGTRWVGTPIGDASGEVSNIQRDVLERNLDGGSVSIASAGDVILAQGAKLDVSGGSVQYGDGYVKTSQLVTKDGRVVDVANAAPDVEYAAIVDGVTVTHRKWGVTEVFSGIYGSGNGQFQQGYVEGSDAGSLTVLAPRFALDGDLVAGVTVGPNQRSADADDIPFLRRPLGGELVIGSSLGGRGPGSSTNFVAGRVELNPDRVLPLLRNDDGSVFDPLVDPWPGAEGALHVRPEWLRAGAARRVTILTNEPFEVPSDAALDLGPGGSFAVSAPNVHVAGTVRATGGSIAFTATETLGSDPEALDVTLLDSSALDVSGSWTNDNPLLNPGGAFAPRFIDGGSIRVEGIAASVQIGSGSSLLATGGAWLDADQRLVAGTGGDIGLKVSQRPLLPLASLRFDAASLDTSALFDGGALSIAANEICIAAADCRGAEGEGLWIRSDVFAVTGASRVALTADVDGLTLLAGTALTAKQSNLSIVGDVSRVATGTSLASFTQRGVLPDLLRKPVDLALTVRAFPGISGILTNASMADAGALTIEQGSRIDADVASHVALRANSRIAVDGTIAAPAGGIDLTIDSASRLTEFLTTQNIWIGPHAELLAAGVFQPTPSDIGLRTGELLNGGSIGLHATRGAVIVSAGAKLDVSGASADVDVRTSQTAFERRALGSSGGEISFSAAESMLLSGTLLARGGSASAAGGTLKVTIDGNTRGGDPTGTDGPASLPNDTRRVLVTDTFAPFSYGPTTALAPNLYGRALVAAPLLTDSGADVIELTARNLFSTDFGTQFVASIGEVAFEGGVTLGPRARLVIDAPTLSGSGDVHLASAYVSIGSTDRTTQDGPSSLLSGTGKLTVDADLVDFVGTSTLQGFERATVTSKGDIRARGVQRIAVPDQLSGSLTTLADLALNAAQIYPTTLTSFAVKVGDGTTGTLSTGITSSDRALALTAGGQLTLQAARIDHAGVLRAPLGQMRLLADEIVLRPGSLLSSSLEGATPLFGVLQIGSDWAYKLQEATLVFTNGQDAFPEQRVSMVSPAIDVQTGATLDLSGGGDLLAYEFVPGVGGSRDVLSAEVDANTFAIVPRALLPFAPHDPAESLGTRLQVGDSVHLEAAAGLPAGDYALLPARYALMPGAFLVTHVEGYQDILPTERYDQVVGGSIVSGYRMIAGTNAGSGARDGRTSGFYVRPGSVAREQAQYDTALATQFFTQRATDGDTAIPRLPIDSGVLSILAEGELALNGKLIADHADGARGAQFDLAGTALRIVHDSSSATSPGEVSILDSSINALGAESIFIGGSRFGTRGAQNLDVLASSVVIDPNVAIAVPELLIGGRDSVLIGANATIAASGAPAASPNLTLSGDGAFLRVSTGEQSLFTRNDVTAVTGTLTVSENAAIRTSGSTILSASKDTVQRGKLELAGASLLLESSRITLGTSETSVSGAVLGDGVLKAGLSELVLRSASTVDVASDLDLTFGGRLVFDAAALAVGDAVDKLSIRAERIDFRNSGVATSAAAGSGGRATFVADEIRLRDGDVAIGGAASVVLDARNAIVADGRGRLSATGGLDLAAGTFTATRGSDYTVDAAGRLSLLPSGTAGAAPADLQSLGSRVAMLGDSVSVASVIDLPSGILSVTSRNTSGAGISLLSGAVLDVSGSQTEFDGVAVAAPGGSVSLTALSGDVLVAGGARVDVSGGPIGDAGSMSLGAAQGAVQIDGAIAGAAAQDYRGGSASINAREPGTLDRLADLLTGGGFTESVDVRRRGVGDMLLSAGKTLRSAALKLAADSGAIRLLGLIDARGEDGGDVAVFARDGVRVQGRIDAAATGAEGEGGHVSLGAGESGGVWVDTAAQIELSGAEGGDLTLRAPSAAVASLLDADAANDRVALSGNVVGARRVDLELYDVLVDADGVLSLTDVDPTTANPSYAAAEATMAFAPAVATALGRGDDPLFRVLPGLEIRASGNLSLDTDWNLFGWRFAGLGGTIVPGALTLRAGGDLVFNGSLSDGFSTPVNGLLTSTANSWSYRLVSGADSSGADLLSVMGGLDPLGDIVIAPGVEGDDVTAPVLKQVRTGTGRIEMAANRDLVLSNAYSVVYTSGIATPGMRVSFVGGFRNRLYPDGGGDVVARAGRDIVGAQAPDFFVNSWLWRVGQNEVGARPIATGWTVAFDRFAQGIGALGGGTLDVTAGRDILDFSAAVPSVGRRPLGATPDSTVLDVIAGGDLRVVAGRNLTGGTYYAGRGNASIEAHGDVGVGKMGLLPILALGDGRMSLTGWGDVGVEGVVNPSLLPQSVSQQAVATGSTSFFSSYAPTSRAELVALAGDLRLRNDDSTNGLVEDVLNLDFTGTNQVTLRTYPSTVRAASLRGDVLLDGSMALFPAPKGNVELFAYENVRTNPTKQIAVILSDAEISKLPSISSAFEDAGRIFLELLGSAESTSVDFRATTPVHSPENQPDGIADTAPSRVVALTGDIGLDTSGVNDASAFFLPKTSRFVAGRDIRNLRLTGMHFGEGDVSSVIAGRDITYPLLRDSSGNLQRNTRELNLAGPGRLELVAGRDVLLQNSGGIETTGNLSNASLPSGGADVSIAAGLKGRVADYPAFLQRYVVGATTYDQSLIAFVEKHTGATNLGKAQALELFASLDESLRTSFLEATFFTELRAGGRVAASSPNQDFTRAFAALETLFPGSNPDSDAGETGAYDGDLSLFFSRVYTLDGGDIRFLVPGGSINAGISTPPTAFGLSKDPEELGVVVQRTGSVSALSFGDFEVNESRVFAADGGNILVWSTRGDIDAGRGAKTAISAPAPVITFDRNGNPQVDFPAALTGSGIRTLASSPGAKPGDVDLFAPRGVVNAGDAGIVAGNLTIAATAVLGADNISVSGVSVGVPVDTGGFGAGLTGVSAVASSASNAATESVAPERQGPASETPLADQALGFLDVFVTGFGDGETACDPQKENCEGR